jgi:8-oxo-dGTP pyrophosphatase MutT (NUDIX family)
VYVDERDGSTPASKMADDLCSSRSKVIDVDVKHATPWLEFRSLTYLDPTGATRRWDMVGRATRSESAKSKGIDAVCVFATLRKKGEEDTTLLVRQFRPPMNGETIELPAGLVDADEDPIVAALRELKEETGYVGTVAGGDEATGGRGGDLRNDNETNSAARVGVPAMTPALPLSPGLSNETVALVRVDVDLDAPENANPRQQLEGSEFITVLRVPIAGLRLTLDALAARGYNVFAGLYTMALGMEMGEGR